MIVYLHSEQVVYVKSDSIETDDGVVLAETSHGSRVAIPVDNIAYMINVD